MKKTVSLFILAIAAIGTAPAFAATNVGARAGSSADLTGLPATRERANVDYTMYETRTTTTTYTEDDAAPLYYTQPAARSAIYKSYQTPAGTTTTVRQTRAETTRREVKRKYYLAHPFYQPLQGKIGSVTDFAYASNGFDFNINQTYTDTGDQLTLNGRDGSWKNTMFSVKEDLSFGITDTFAIVGMLRYDITNKNKFEISGEPASDKDNGLNVYGIGLRWRMVDTADWIATITPQYQRYNDTINFAIMDAQVGYKVARTTIYGLGRLWYGFFDENSYGAGMSFSTPADGTAFAYIPYKEDTDHMLYIEGGAGVFSVLDEDWTLNLEGTFGHYDWHNQFALKGAIGWQPNDWFALNLYGRVSLYDSADNKTKNLWWQESTYDTGISAFTNIGTVKMDNSTDYSVGIQAIFEF